MKLKRPLFIMLAVISCLCGIISVNNSKTMANSSPIVYSEKNSIVVNMKSADSDSSDYVVFAGQTIIENDELTIPVMLSNNRGIMGYVIEVDYDESVITPINIELGTIVADNSIFDTNIGKNDGQLKVLWSGSDEVKDDGSMFNIIFKINDTSKETTDIKMKYSKQDTFDEQYKDVHLDISDISVSLKTSGEEGENVKPTETPMVTPTATPDIGATPTQSPDSDNSKPSENPMPTTKPSGEEKKDSGSSISVNKKEITSEKIKLKKLNIKSLKSISKGKLALKWNKSKDKISGYEVQYSIKNNFKKKTVKKVSKNRTSLTITKLKSKKKYYVRIRSYMRYTSKDGAVKIIYSNWSNVKVCKVK